MLFHGTTENNRRTFRKKERVPITSVIASRKAAHPRVASLALWAIHLLAIRNPCDAEHRPAPVGPERCGLPRPYGLAMTVVVGGWPFGFGGAVIVPDRRGQCRPPYHD